VRRSLVRHARLFRLYFSQYAKARLEYRLDFFSSVFASFLGTAAAFGFLLIVFSRVPAVKGWSFEEMVFLYGFSLIPLGVFNVFSWNLYLFSDRYLIEGRFDRVLLNDKAAFAVSPPEKRRFTLTWSELTLASPSGRLA
jgi:ABC-2 type transport system permease protein